ncbi:cysteine methyltransferase [Arthrobacter sp. SW1]|uniref:methylated-DNA--[protein]-cysteine S-methyltransferase n=1 Tax=Arthrobacter sp. SW1 TaxID=1920889 RepID=UPI000877C245|nr:methylated-DNA--[protein]-cysteine S-methyltransferase [Arthrobacter sp. SW1]OFI36461.1 cysteine methyltransferase [Arthrobacter sp. SW1]
MTTRHTTIGSPLGELTFTSRDGVLSGIFYEGHWHMPPQEFFGDPTTPEDPVFAPAIAQVRQYLQGERTAFELEYKATGNEFQERVWARLENIPYGETITYGALAAELGDPNLAQAVGSAVGRNPLSIVIPCHRVVGSGGRLTGYAGGLSNKRFLLELEEPAAVRESKLF